MKKNKIAALIMLFSFTTTFGQVQQVDTSEKIADTIELVAIAVKDIVVDTAATVKRGINRGTDATKSFVTSALQKARAKQQAKKNVSITEQHEALKKVLAETQEQLKLAQMQLQEVEKNLPPAE